MTKLCLRKLLVVALAAGVAACSSGDTQAPAPTGGSDGRALLAAFLKTGGADLDSCLAKLPVMRGPGATLAAPGMPVRPVRVDRLVVALDASGSMAARVGGETRMAAAKAAAARFLSTVPKEIDVGLVAFGHKGDNTAAGKAASCAAVETMVPLGRGDAARVTHALQGFEAAGWTPLASAITSAGRSFTPTAVPGSQVVYVVSDGLETCGGDPVAAARALHDGGVRAIVNIIGFGLTDADRAQLKSVAAAGGGEFVEATTASELRLMMDRLYNRAASVSTLATEQYDAAGRIRDNNFASAHYQQDANQCLIRGTQQERDGLVGSVASAPSEAKEAARLALSARHEDYRNRALALAKQLDTAREAANAAIQAQEQASEKRLLR